MKIISINSGSSSLKFTLLNMPSEEVIFNGSIEKIGYEDAIFNFSFEQKKTKQILLISDHNQAIQLLLDFIIKNKIVNSLEEIQGVGHRIVQGGELFEDSVVLTDENIDKVESLNDLAPLHNFANVLGIRIFKQILPKVLQVGVFDTTFHKKIPEKNFLYALPYEWYQKYKLRKYGAHGISYQFVSQRAEKIFKKNNLKMIICHIGNGVSLAAVQGKQSIDTSMGLTPLEGVPMGTRSGNIDPTIISFMSKKEGKTTKEILDILNKKSGMLGISGISNDCRVLEKMLSQKDKRTILAFNVQVKRIVDYIASYYVLLKGIDVLIFTAGIGENSSFLRKEIVKQLDILNIFLDLKLNEETKGVERIISRENSSVQIVVIPTNEELKIAQDVFKFKKIKNNK
ncbi:MAG: acetate kinase [Candidatus Phytoplasma stylosanthis]|uniref:acetate kinase n=2 Tax=Candidatus Phytoplasma stylosanthis TaxID=2798314 RepID=UPI00293B42FC|nr:acetate kinase [Candidatus Phytoplasma stylosanthis]MDV3170707.1 acetate kinase [Candidatus Phytoplasma stylosanthis]MDV3173900.1 acetate kinase [Candidatus Phytoplasma stylosanthis]MDV3173964.1 acetate kinase [Candidatus Phytoplasma stylosanthis]MDV3202662.1 acetate kinase [Candidatus Phytoplasma stylosanthis]